METPIEVLRVEQSGISKELARFRACDAETRSLYCREWAQFVYKKHFVWNAKTQEEVPEGQQLNTHGGLQAGPYQINFINDDTTGQDDVYKKERSALMIKKFMSLVESWTTTPARADEESLITQIVQACQLWTTLPSGYSGLPDLFEPVEFNPYPDAIPLVEDAKDPSQLLDPLIIERQALCLPSDCFHLLKNLTGDILLSHTTPTCNHSKPTAKTPSDLDVDKAIFNEHEAVAVKKALAELKIALEHAWHPLNNFLDQVAEFDKRRSRLMGKGCQKTIDAFFASQKFVSFVDIWASQLTAFKNKKSTPEEIAKVDSLFEQHLEHMKVLVNEFMKEFAVAHLKKIHVLTTDLWKMIVPTIYEMGERMAAHEDHKGNKNANASKIGESLKALDINSLKKMESTKEIDAAQDRIVDNLEAKVTEYILDIDNLLKLYREGRNNLSGRIEKLSNKDFKKKIKKVESGYYSIRQTFRYEVTENIFPEALFCKFSLVCLEPLMQEGEVMEAVTIEKEVKRFVESHKDLLQQKCALMEDFEQGVQTGRRELAGVLGKLFLKEGMRIQGDNLALKRQQTLLKSMGVVPEEQKKKTKSKNKSSPVSSGTSTPALVEEATKKVSVKEKAIAKDKKTSSSTEKKVFVVEKKPSISEKKAVITAKKSTAPENKPIVTEKMSNVPEKKPAVFEKKPVAAEKKFTVVDKKITPEGTKPITEKKPVPEKKTIVVEQKPIPVEKNKSVVAEIKKTAAESKKQSSVVTEKKEAPHVKQNTSPTVVVPNAKTSANQSNDVQDWDTIRSSVMTAESNKKPSEPEVQDWDTLRAQVMLSNEKKPASATNTANTSLPGGWSSIAATPPSFNASEPKTKKPAVTSTPPDLDQWPTPISRSPKQNNPSSSVIGNKWSNIATASTISLTENASEGWSEVTSPASNAEIKKDVELGGWGVSKVNSLSSSSSAAAWSNTTTAGWNTPTDKKGWSSPSASDKKKQTKWSTISREKESNLSLDGWETPSTLVGGSSADDNWRSSSKKSINSSTATAPLASASWDNAKLPWNNEPSTASNISPSSSATPIMENVKKPVVQPVVTSNSTAAPTVNVLMNATSNASQPPGIETSNANVPPPPGIQAPKVMPPGLSTPTTAIITSATSNNFNSIGMPATTPTTPMSALSAPIHSTTSNQLQEPLPHDIDEMSTDMLLMIVKNLHRENGNLIQSVYSMQQEMGMMTSRYAEIIALARERETQTLALFESRKQTEMEEARRYVLSLEARVKQLEEQGHHHQQQQAQGHTSIAGFGNQDLFAGYREEMAPAQQQQQPHHHHNHQNHRNHSRKLWQKNTVVRCGNCGEVGHASQECKVNIFSNTQNKDFHYINIF